MVLDVGLNFVDDAAMTVIAKGLEKNRVLRNLSLKGNGIGEKVYRTCHIFESYYTIVDRKFVPGAECCI